MKGLTHFISGVAAATFFPEAVKMAYTENSFIIVLGGIFGILPDTLDFKFAQFFEKYEFEVDPDPENPDPQMIADKLAEAINTAHETGEPKSIIFMTIKRGADLWRQYSLYFDIENSKVIVEIGPLVNTSKKPYPGTEIKGKRVAEAKINCKLCKQVYDKKTYVDIMSGPSFKFIPLKDGSVKIEFLSWHRRWSHSLTLGAFFGIIGWLIAGILIGWQKAYLYGLVITAGFWVHIIEDQFGYMGNNLFWPFTKEKVVGTKSMHSGDAWPNFATVWLALVLILYNLNRFRGQPILHMSFIEYFILTYILPLGFIYIIDKILNYFETKEEKEKEEKEQIEGHTHQAETQKELEEGFAS